MPNPLRGLWRKLTGTVETKPAVRIQPARPPAAPAEILPFAIAPDDPLLLHFLNAPGVVEINKLRLESPTLAALKAANYQVVAPLVSQGQLIGLLNLGERRSEQEYSSDDLRLLNNLVSQAAPAVRVAQLVQQQQIEARQRERIEQELRVARIVQETLLPRQLPSLNGWRIDAYWQPAQAIGGDFYDFIGLPNGKLGIVIGDVTDKGVPAALVMASTRSILRGAAERYVSPGQVLARVNNLLCPDMPAKMFVTCLYAIFDPTTGHFWFANAGHNPPGQQTANGVIELRARGMPLGLLPDMVYEEAETTLAPGDSILLYSDGLIEAHNTQREMFGFPRLRQLMSAYTADLNMIEWLKHELTTFTGPNWLQEDDVTLVMLERLPQAQPAPAPSPVRPSVHATQFSVASQPGNERLAMTQVAAYISQIVVLPPARLDRLKTAVAEATMNAIEHGNHYQAELFVDIEVAVEAQRIVIRINDHGGDKPIPDATAPDLQAKLDGHQSPRGWGLFLIKNMVDEMQVRHTETKHTLELIFKLP